MSKYKIKGRRKKKKTAIARLNDMEKRLDSIHPKTDPEKNRKTMMVLFLSCVTFLGIYLAAWILQDTRYYYFSIAVEVIYYLLLAALILAFVTINRGISNDIPRPDQLSDELTQEQKQDFIADIKACRARARPLAYVIFPLLFIVGFDIIYTVFIAK